MTEKDIRRKVESAFYDYKQHKARGVQYIVEKATDNLGVQYDSVRVSGGSCDPEARIVAIIDRTQADYLWCRVVELTRERYAADPEASEIITRYFRGARRYRRARMVNICASLYISDMTFYRILTRVLNYATLLAIQFGLVNVINFEKI